MYQGPSFRDDCRISYLNKAETKEVSIEVNMHVSSVNMRSMRTCATSRAILSAMTQPQPSNKVSVIRRLKEMML